ncbi:hypothetical protein HQO24_22950 [Rhodococcus fascians]|nr:hypothetical protein [Rhodococcus fascians]MBY4408883.1 hypothetical protein [Rhodococcus fascians]MBY4423936.1 hypothetical protein [Rhodococcus fascians]
MAAQAGAASNPTTRFSKNCSSKAFSQKAERLPVGFGTAAQPVEWIEHGVGRSYRTVPIGGSECARRILVRLR